MTKHRLNIALIFGLVVVVASARVQAKRQYTPLDIAQLPDYCQARLAGDEQIKKLWRQRMGEDYIHLHHYCGGLIAMQRASAAPDRKAREAHLKGAVWEFNYVLRSWSPGFYLVENAKRQKSLALTLLGRAEK